MSSLLRMKVVPVLNGNDVVAPDPAIGSDLRNVRMRRYVGVIGRVGGKGREGVKGGVVKGDG